MQHTPDREAMREDARLQADPELALGTGRARSRSIILTALAVLAIVAVVIYGMTQRGGTPSGTAGNQSASTPPTQVAPPATANNSGAAGRANNASDQPAGDARGAGNTGSASGAR